MIDRQSPRHLTKEEISNHLHLTSHGDIGDTPVQAVIGSEPDQKHHNLLYVHQIKMRPQKVQTRDDLGEMESFRSRRDEVEIKDTLAIST